MAARTAGAPDPMFKSPAGHPLTALLDFIVSGNVPENLASAFSRLSDTTVLRRTMGRRVVYTSRASFMEQRSPEGAPWKPLKKGRGKGRNPGSKALFDSGSLYESISYELEGDDAVAIGFPKATYYGRFHQDGTKTIPARPFLGVRPDDVAAFEQFLGAHARQAFEAA